MTKLLILTPLSVEGGLGALGEDELVFSGDADSAFLRDIFDIRSTPKEFSRNSLRYALQEAGAKSVSHVSNGRATEIIASVEAWLEKLSAKKVERFFAEMHTDSTRALLIAIAPLLYDLDVRIDGKSVKTDLWRAVRPYRAPLIVETVAILDLYFLGPHSQWAIGLGQLALLAALIWTYFVMLRHVARASTFGKTGQTVLDRIRRQFPKLERLDEIVASLARTNKHRILMIRRWITNDCERREEFEARFFGKLPFIWPVASYIIAQVGTTHVKISDADVVLPAGAFYGIAYAFFAVWFLSAIAFNNTWTLKLIAGAISDSLEAANEEEEA